MSERGFFRALIEYVVNDLDSVQQPALDGFERRIRFVLRNRDAEKTNLARSAQVFDGALPFFGVRPRICPDMKLLQVDLLSVQVPKALVSAIDDVVVGK